MEVSLGGAGRGWCRGFGHAGVVLVHVALSKSSRSNLWFAPCGRSLRLSWYHLKSALLGVSGCFADVDQCVCFLTDQSHSRFINGQPRHKEVKGLRKVRASHIVWNFVALKYHPSKTGKPLRSSRFSLKQQFKPVDLDISGNGGM